MSERRRVFLLVLIMVVVSVIVTWVAITMLYRAALNEERARLVETAQSQARLIEAVARFDVLYSKRDHPEGPAAATLSQIKDAHERYKGFGKTGEFTLSRKEGNNIVFLLSHRHYDLDKPKPVPFDSDLAEPMRLALSGKSGTVIGLDYRGETVLAAYEPVGELNLGIVVKIDLSEIRAPFIRAVLISALIAALAILLGAWLFVKVTNPMIRRLAESEERYRSLVENQTELVSRFTPDGTFVFVNNACCHFFEKTRAELIGKKWHPLPVEDDLSFVQEKLQTLSPSKPTVLIENRILSGKGDIHWMQFVNSGLFDLDGNLKEIQSVGRDITDLKQAEEALQENTNKIKLFAYSISHDLKGPAFSIHGLTKRLSRLYGNILDEKGTTYCDQIVKASEQIVGLAENINVYISTKEAPITIENVNLKNLFQMVRDEIAPQLSIRKLKWSQPDYLPEIKADKLAIVRVIRNLVDNALKYGGDELSEIKIGYQESDDSHILSVMDDGIGLKTEDSKEIFDTFKRTQTSRGIEGAGLGLAIVKEIAERHAGKTWMKPGSERGINFSVSISKNLQLSD